MEPRLQTIRTTREFARAVMSMPAPGPLPLRTVLVPNGRIAHALRREILAAGRADALAGTLFSMPVVAAYETLAARGTQVTLGEEQIRPLRLRVLFRGESDFEYFDAPLLRETLGWDRAFARTISDLEDAGLRPEEIGTASERRVRDLVKAWRHVEADAGMSWTAARVFGEATRLLEGDPSAWPHEGAVLALVDPDRSAVEIRFLESIPAVRRAVLLSRPLRERTSARVSAMLGGGESGQLQTRPGFSPTDRGELSILATYLFEPSDVLTAADRTRSRGLDGTVRLEQYAGVDEEVEAAAEWVVEQVLERGVPLCEIAVLTPARDPYVALLCGRLARLPFEGGLGLPTFAPEGLPATSAAEGARLLQLVRALRRHLDAASLAALLPVLRTDPDGNAKQDGEVSDRRPLSHASAAAIAYGLGTLGGNPADPRGALSWVESLAASEARIAPALADPAQERDRSRLGGLARELRRVRSSVDALVGVARVVIEEAPLREIWSVVAAFARERLVVPPPPSGLLPRLDELFESRTASSAVSALAGEDALRVIEELLLEQRLVRGRFGDPAIYVGTIGGAAGLPFRAVRVVGLTEGAVPSVPREDPVLPDSLRRLLGGGVRTTQDTAERELHRIDRVARDTTESIAFSAPRLDAQRSQREVSSLYVELAAALSRPAEGAPDRPAAIPSTRALERLYLGAARREHASLRPRIAVLDATREALIAGSTVLAAGTFAGDGALDVARIERLLDPGAPPGELDGVLVDFAPDLAARFGLAPERPTSASTLRKLLECPHRVLLERALYFDEPFQPPSSGRVDPLAYGSLLHRVWEAFARRHGQAFAERQRSLDEWERAADEIVDEQFERLTAEYALSGAHVREQQRARVRMDFRTLLRGDWSTRASRYVGTELPFGREQPIALDVPGGPIYLRGFIDRVDVIDGRTWVRDLKTSRPKPRRGNTADPDHLVDVQLGIYGLAAQEMAASLGVPSDVAAAYLYLDADEPRREFIEDWPELARLAREWLGVAASLIRAGLFLRTPREDDCNYCPYRSVCGPGAIERAQALSLQLGEAGASFARLKNAVVQEEATG